MRTCDALGADLILVGYTPRPVGASLKLIAKTAIGAEAKVNWQHFEHWQEVLEHFANYTHLGIEISSRSRNLMDFLKSPACLELDLKTIMLWFGNEIHGLEEKLCRQLAAELHLPMYGSKESLNVANSVCAVGYLFLGFLGQNA